MMEIKYPLADKVARYFFVSELKPEDIGYLGRENGYGDTARKAYHDRVGNKFDDSSQFEYPQYNKKNSRHHGGYH